MTFGILPKAVHLAADIALVEGVDAMPPQPPDRQPSTEKSANAMRWVEDITASGFMLALPCWGGYWLDGRFGTSPWCLIVGGLLGLVASFVHILNITGALKSGSNKK